MSPGHLKLSVCYGDPWKFDWHENIDPGATIVAVGINSRQVAWQFIKYSFVEVGRWTVRINWPWQADERPRVLLSFINEISRLITFSLGSSLINWTLRFWLNCNVFCHFGKYFKFNSIIRNRWRALGVNLQSNAPSSRFQKAGDGFEHQSAGGGRFLLK